MSINFIISNEAIILGCDAYLTAVSSEKLKDKPSLSIPIRCAIETALEFDIPSVIIKQRNEITELRRRLIVNGLDAQYKEK